MASKKTNEEKVDKTLEERLMSKDSDTKFTAEGEALVNMHWLAKYKGLVDVSAYREADNKVRALREIGYRFSETGNQSTIQYSDPQIHRMFVNVYNSYRKQFNDLPKCIKANLLSAYRTEYGPKNK